MKRIWSITRHAGNIHGRYGKIITFWADFGVVENCVVENRVKKCVVIVTDNVLPGFFLNVRKIL
jgi:hypothetical protein